MGKAESIAEGFRAVGFNVRIDKSRSGLSVVQSGAAVRCGDGRPGDDSCDLFEGPTVFGGAPGHAALIALSHGKDVVTTSDLDKAISVAAKQNFVASTHNIHEYDIHCAQQGKMVAGQLGMRQEFSPVEARDRVLESGGVSMSLSGKHLESELLVIMAEGMTHIPVAWDQKFTTAAWWLLRDGVTSSAIVYSAASLLLSIRDVVSISNVRVMV